LAALEAQGLSQKVRGQATAGLTIGAGGRADQLARELGIDPVGAAGPGVGDNGLEGMVVLEPLKEQIPEGDQRSEESLIKGKGLKGRQLEQGAAGEELDKKPQQLGWGEAGRAFSGFGFGGVFFDGIEYAYYGICIPICYPPGCEAKND
jgi:hypothetical protein